MSMHLMINDVNNAKVFSLQDKRLTFYKCNVKRVLLHREKFLIKINEPKNSNHVNKNSGYLN